MAQLGTNYILSKSRKSSLTHNVARSDTVALTSSKLALFSRTENTLQNYTKKLEEIRVPVLL